MEVNGKSMTKEYTVEGLPTYITKIEDIPEDMMTKKKGDAWGSNTRIYLVYNIGAMEKNEDMGVENHFNYYYMVGFEDLIKLPDGLSIATPIKVMRQ